MGNTEISYLDIMDREAEKPEKVELVHYRKMKYLKIVESSLQEACPWPGMCTIRCDRAVLKEHERH